MSACTVKLTCSDIGTRGTREPEIRAVSTRFTPAVPL